MPGDFHRRTTWLVLCGYFLAITAAPGLHQHGDSHRDSAAGCGHVSQAPSAWASTVRDGEEHCPACQFLLQKSAPAAHSAETAWGHLCVRLPGFGPARFFSRAPLVERCRAPPSAA
jgi:hypothetical protein